MTLRRRCTGANHNTEIADSYISMSGRGAFQGRRRLTVRTAGALGSENAGVSSASWVRIPATDCLRFSGEGSSSQSKSGPKARLKSVVDGQQVYLPVLLIGLME